MVGTQPGAQHLSSPSPSGQDESPTIRVHPPPHCLSKGHTTLNLPEQMSTIHPKRKTNSGHHLITTRAAPVHPLHRSHF